MTGTMALPVFPTSSANAPFLAALLLSIPQLSLRDRLCLIDAIRKHSHFFFDRIYLIKLFAKRKLDALPDIGVVLRHETDSATRFSGSRGSSDPVDICLSISLA